MKVLKESGLFNGVIGLIIGRTRTPLRSGYTGEECYNAIDINYEQERVYIEQILKEVKVIDIPILGNVACSHTHPMVTLPLGRMVSLDADKQTLTIYSK